MRTVLLFFALFVCAPSGFAQYTWQGLGDSLIHSQRSLLILAQKTDSLNKAFERYQPVEPVLSAQQGYGRYFRIFDATFSLDLLKLDLKNGLSYQQLAKKYPSIEWVRDSVLIYRFENTNWEGKTEQVFAEAPYRLEHGYDPQNWIHPEITASHFVFETYTVGDSGHGFLLYSPLSRQDLPGEAKRMLQYIDFALGEKPKDLFESRNSAIPMEVRQAAAACIQKFLGWQKVIPPERRDSLKQAILLKYAESAAYRKEVEAVADATLILGNLYPYQVNDYILPCFSLQKQFELLCHQPLDWGCGNDPGPRLHMLKTAQLAAEMGDLPVFLQAHFRIINDCYGGIERYPNSRTYFRELEAIGMDVVSLSIGAALFIQQWPKGNIAYLGKSLSEISNPETLEDRLIQNIANPKLDDLNRLRLIWLYRNYARADKKTQAAKLKKLRTIAPTLPPKMRAAVLD